MSRTNHAIICLYYYRNVREYHIFEPSNLNAGGKVADWSNGVCWAIGPKHFKDSVCILSGIQINHKKKR